MKKQVIMIVKPVSKELSKSRMKILLFCLLCIVTVKADVVKIYYSSGNNGSLESCTCPHDRNSGIIGRVSKLLRLNNPNSIFIEAGNFFAANQDTLDFSINMEIMNVYPPDIVCAGYNDLDFINIFKKSKFPVLGYNIQECLTSKLIAKDGIILGFVSAVDENYSIRYDSLVKHIDYKKLKNDISALKRQCDLLFFISSLSDEQEGRLFGECKDIDFLISVNRNDKTDDRFGDRYLTALGRRQALLGEISIDQKSLKVVDHRFISVDVDSVVIDNKLQIMVDEHKINKLKK